MTFVDWFVFAPITVILLAAITALLIDRRHP